MKDSAGGFAEDVREIGEACATVLAMLNRVTAAKRESILRLAERGSPEPRASAAASAPPPSASLTEAVKQAEDTAGTLGSNPSSSPIALLESAVVQAIAMAIHNTVAANQQLDILAQAVLSKEAALLLGGGSPARASQGDGTAPA
jgi:hypothetical protein